MKLTFSRSLPLIGLLLLCFTGGLRAQEPVGLHITALTSTERDSLAQSMPGGLHLVFACVPADVLVFSSTEGGVSRENLRAQAVQAIQPLLGSGRIAEGTLTLHAAEQACENARTQ